MQFVCNWSGPDSTAREKRKTGSRCPQPRDNRVTKLSRLLLAKRHHGPDPESPRLSPMHVLPSLTLSNTSCANSMQLSNYERLLLEFFPSSTVYYLHSARGMSPLQYVCQVTACSSSMVMQMILAVTARELAPWRCITGSHGVSTTQFALQNYTAALGELQRYIGTESAWINQERVDAILATIFLMIQFGLQSTTSLDHAKVHVAGLQNLVTSQFLVSNPGKLESQHGLGLARKIGLSPLSSQLLLWILYAMPC